MPRIARRILRAGDVAFEEPFHLDLEPPAEPRSKEPPAHAGVPAVRVAQTHPEYAVIEITCPCGKTTYVRCDYAARSS